MSLRRIIFLIFLHLVIFMQKSKWMRRLKLWDQSHHKTSIDMRRVGIEHYNPLKSWNTKQCLDHFTEMVEYYKNPMWSKIEKVSFLQAKYPRCATCEYKNDTECHNICLQEGIKSKTCHICGSTIYGYQFIGIFEYCINCLNHRTEIKENFSIFL